MHSEYNGCAFWRMFEPARFLNTMYNDVSVTFFPNEAYNEKSLTEWENIAKSHDLLVMGRVSEQQSLQTFLVVREISKKAIVTELDDDWKCVEKENISYKHWEKDSEAYNVARQQMEHTDIVQCSTLPLMRSMSEFKKKTFVSPNLIDIDKCDILSSRFKDRKDKMVRVGWAGGANHYGDFLHSGILDALKIIADKYKNVKFVFKGMNADFFMEKDGGVRVAKDNSKKMQIVEKAFTDLDRIELSNGCGFFDWQKAVSELDLDIVLVPLKDSKFNKSKSNCRYLEFAGLKIPGIYSDVYPYSNTIEHGVDGYLAKNKDDWVKYISLLIEDKLKRDSIKHAGYNKVREQYSLQNNIGIWRDNLIEMAEYSLDKPFVSYYSG